MAASHASRGIAATIGARVRLARRSAGLTQHELAVQLGSGDAMTISRWERGEHSPSGERLVALAELFDVEIAWFYEPIEDAA